MISAGMKVLVSDTPRGILLRPIPRLEDLAGVDAGRVTVQEMKRRLDRMRSEDHYRRSPLIRVSSKEKSVGKRAVIR